MIDLIKRYKLDWVLLLLSINVLFIVTPLFSYFQGSIEHQYSLWSKSVIAGLTLYFLSCVIHILPKALKIIGDKSSDNRIHLISVILFSLYVFYLHSTFNFYGDEVTYLKYFSDKQLFDFVTYWYTHMTPTMLIHALVGALVKNDPFFWRFFDSFAFIILVESIVLLIYPKGKRRYAIPMYALFFLLPPQLYGDTGWCATTLNYLWPASATLILFSFYKRAVFANKPHNEISLFSKFASVFLLLLAGNCIQSEILLFFVTLSMIGWVVYRERSLAKVPNYLWLSMVVIIFSLLIITLCPGNSVRAEDGIRLFFPAFNELNILQKLHIGLINSCTFFYGVGPWGITPNHLPYFVAPLSLLLCALLLKKEGIYVRILAVVLATISAILFIGAIAYSFFPEHYISQKLLLFSYRFITNAEIGTLQATIITIVYLLLSLSILIGLALAYRNQYHALLMSLVYLAGICCSLVVSFSPTIYASAERVMLFNAISIGIVTASLLLEWTETTMPRYKYFCGASLLLFIFTIYVNTEWNSKFRFPDNSYTTAKSAPSLPYSDTPLTFCIDRAEPAEYDETMIAVYGWAFDVNTKNNLDDLLVKVNDSTIICCQYNFLREDVRTALNLNSAEIGFVVNIPVQYVNMQDSLLQFIGVSNDRKKLYQSHYKLTDLE